MLEAPRHASSRNTSKSASLESAEVLPGHVSDELEGARESGIAHKPVADEVTTRSPKIDTVELPDEPTEAIVVVDEPAPPARAFKMSYGVRLGGAILAVNAGFVNAVAFHSLGTFVSHVTGSTSRIGLGWVDPAKVDEGDSTLMVVSFVAGSILTGFLISKNTINFGLALYDMCLLSESILLICVTTTHKHKIARYLAAVACGLQNGMATHWGGAVLRTTHVTGLFTDVGLLLGRLLSLFCRKRCGSRFDDFDKTLVEDDISKLSILGTIAITFVIGVTLGASCYKALKHHAFLLPAGLTGCAGLLYSCYRVVGLGQRFFSDAEMEAVEIPAELAPEIPENGGLAIEAPTVPFNDTETMVFKTPEEAAREPRQGSKGSREPRRVSWGSTGSREPDMAPRMGSKLPVGDVVCVSRATASKLEADHPGLDLHHQR